MTASNVCAIIDSAEDFRPAPQELKEAGLSQRDALLTVCDDACVWRSTDGEAYASVPMNGHIEHHLIAFRSFKNWMLYSLAHRFLSSGRPASAGDNTVRDARAAVEARCLTDNVIHSASVRVEGHQGSIILDIGSDDWSALRVTSEGWSTVGCTPIPIVRGKRTAPFVSPAHPATFNKLRQLLAHLDDDSFILIVAWCLGALLPNGPYPVLVLGGEQGSGKSTLARLIQKITDPVRGDLLQPPRDDRDLIAMAKASRVLSFDNFSKIKDDLADSLCRLSTGSEIGGRALFSNTELSTFAASRPLIINGIPDLAARGDLADRAIVIKLPPLPERITEADWKSSVEETLPNAFAGFLEALSCGIANLDTTSTPDVRMADFARFVAAAESALPWPAGAFLEAYQNNRKHSNAALADYDCIVRAIRGFMSGDRQEWSGLMSELYQELSKISRLAHPLPDDWPGNARWFGDRLSRCSPTLRSIGINVSQGRTRDGMKVTLCRIAAPATHTSQSEQMQRPKSSFDASGVASAASSLNGSTDL